MDNKVILISIDGMRPDGFLQCGHPFAQQMLKEWSYTLTARSVSPKKRDNAGNGRGRNNRLPGFSTPNTAPSARRRSCAFVKCCRRCRRPVWGWHLDRTPLRSGREHTGNWERKRCPHRSGERQKSGSQASGCSYAPHTSFASPISRTRPCSSHTTR